MKKGDICIIGMGRFGYSVLNTLVSFNKNVVVIDEEKATISKYASKASFAACLDSTDEAALRELGVDKMDTVIIAIGSDIEASIMTAAIILDMGVPNIIAKATSSRHEQVLRKLGVESIITPEFDGGKKAAERAIYGLAFNSTAVNDKTSIIKVNVSSSEITGKPLSELNLRSKYGFSLVSMSRNNDVIIPRATDEIQIGDEVILITDNSNISKIEKVFGVKRIATATKVKPEKTTKKAKPKAKAKKA